MTTQLDMLDREWIRLHEGAVLDAFRGRPDFMADDVRALKSIVAPADDHWWGIMFASLKRRGLIKRLGYRASKRKAANGRPVCIWAVV